MNDFYGALTAALAALNISYTPSQLEQCGIYCRLLREANEKMNLTAITDPREMALKHFADSLCLLSYDNLAPSASLIDIGTGAGFPGLPLKIMRGDLQVTLLDSLEKRCNFLHKVISELGLTNIEVVWDRAETAGQNQAFRANFTYATARAVADLPVLLEYALPLLSLYGKFFALKGKKQDSPMDHALTALGGELSQEVGYNLPITGEERRLYIFSKLSPTPDKYPRRPGKATKKPL